MDTLSEKRAAVAAVETDRRKREERLAQVALAVLRSQDGQELLSHLIQRFDLTGRVFLSSDRGEVNAVRAALRDGERTVVRHLIDLCRRADKDFSIPL
jgi:hypothetical protein